MASFLEDPIGAAIGVGQSILGGERDRNDAINNAADALDRDWETCH